MNELTTQMIGLVLVTHGLALRVFLMRWFGWSVDEVLRVFNPPNATPIVLERVDASSAATRDASSAAAAASASSSVSGMKPSSSVLAGSQTRCDNFPRRCDAVPRTGGRQLLLG